MANRFFIAIFLIAALGGMAAAKAQECPVEYELIYDLHNAPYGSYNIWDGIYGSLEAEEKFASGIVTESGNTVVAGERLAIDATTAELIQVQYDPRGRVMWEKSHKVANLSSVVKMLPMKNGVLVMVNRREKKSGDIWLGFFNAEGELKAQKSIKDGRGTLTGYDIIPSRTGEGFVMVAGFTPAGEKTENSVFYRLDGNGGIIAHRSFTPGLDNAMYGIDPAGTNDYIATGYITTEQGRKAGWMVRLDFEGEILWQRPYARGRESSLNSAQDMLGRFIVVAGESAPVGNGASAGWVMVVDNSTGDIGWQRYYRGGHAYQARDVLVAKDGMISVMLNGQPLTALEREAYEDKKDKVEEESEEATLNADKQMDYVRVLSLTPRGILFISDEYFNDDGAQAVQMIAGKTDERIMIGSTNISYTPAVPEGQKPKTARSQNGWVIAGTAIEPSNDPCMLESQ